MKIFKYELNMLRPTKLSLPHSYRALSVGLQDGVAYMWIAVPSDFDGIQWATEYEVCMFGTGWDIKDEATVGKDFVGTVQYPNGLVGHVFIDKCVG
jgi:hypothetical protein